MINNLIFETIIDPADIRLTEFRKAIFSEDLGINPDFTSIIKPHSWWIEKYNEDAYKYSDKKWFDVKFDAIEVASDNNRIVSMCGAKIYKNTVGDKFLRINMFYYTLKSHRKLCNGIIYVDKGFDDRHIKFSKTKDCKGMFFSIYAYSTKLKALVINHSTRRISNVKSKLKHLDNIKHIGPYELNNVIQEFFYFPLSEHKFDPKTLIL
jgi:hypothetical protein